MDMKEPQKGHHGPRKFGTFSSGHWKMSLKRPFSSVLVLVLLLQALASGSKTPRCPQYPSSSSSSMSTNVEGPKVFLTVSSLAATNLTGTALVRERLVELNWLRGALRSDDWVGLFDHDPTNNPLYPLDKALAGDVPQGFLRTSVQLPFVEEYEGPLRRICLGFWIGYVSAGKTVAVDCLKTEPSWMDESRDYIGNLKLIDTFIPGTHDSGSYEAYRGLHSEGPLTRWVMTQDENFWNQLVLGIRYFDMRVAYYASSPHLFWLNHGVVRVNPLSEAIAHLRRFLNETREIVVLDFHNFPVGFTNRPERHDELSAYLSKELGQFMLPRSIGYEVTLKDIWDSGRRLVVGYSHQSYQANPYFWPGIPQRWANTMDLSTLHSYLSNYMENGSSALWAAMAEFTPSPAAVILLYRSSLRTFADSVNRNLTLWVRDEWWHGANIVATDYFRGNNVVDLAIQSNLRRATCRQEQARLTAEANYNARVRPPYVGPRSSRRRHG